MADNIAVTPGSGAVVAADDVAGILHQRVKIAWGVDGAAVDASATNPFPIANTALGDPADAAYSGSGNGSTISLLKKLVAQFAAGFTMSGSVSLADAEGVKGQFGLIAATPSQTFTRPADTIAYSPNDLVANNTTGASVAYGSITAARVAAGSFRVSRLRLYTNHTAGLAGVSVRVRLWTTAPTYSSGDNNAYGVTSGYAGYLGSFAGAFEQWGDGAVAFLGPDVGPALTVKLGSGQAIFWDIQTLAAFTPQSAKIFTLTVEVDQN